MELCDQIRSNCGIIGCAEFSGMTNNSRRFSRLYFAIVAAMLVVVIGAAIWGTHSLIATKPPDWLPNQSEPQITGQIVDESGQPIPRASISRHITDSDAATATAQSDAEGRFVFHTASAGSQLLLIVARGYTPQLHDVRVDSRTPPIRIVLSTGAALHGRVVDPGGKAVPGAIVEFIWWRFGYNEPYRIVSTDGSGNFEFPDVPTDGGELEVYRDGFQANKFPLPNPPAGDVITLKPSEDITFSGRVLDAQTHQPIRKFQVLRAWNSHAGRFIPMRGPFGDGVYKLRPLRLGDGVLAYCLRFEADGYRPTISPPLSKSGRQVFYLQPAPDWKCRVIQHDGSPAAGAKVALITGDTVYERDGEVERDMVAHPFIVTGPDGSFDLEQQIGSFELWAWSDAGISHRQYDQSFGDNPQIRLTPWAKLQLKIPWIAESKLPISVSVRSPAERRLGEWQYTVRPNAAGEIEIDRLPPMEGEIAVVGLNRPKPQWETGPMILAKLVPGQTTVMDLTSGVTVTGHVAGDNPVLFLRAVPDKPAGQLPDSPIDSARLLPTVLDYSAKFDGSGNFRIDAVKPGKYCYEAWPDGNSDAVAFGTFDVPATETGQAVDMGELKLSKTAEVKAGQPAPPMLGRTLDDKPILTAGFRGKFVVWVVFDDSLRTGSLLLPLVNLSAQYDRDRRVALVAINAELLMRGVPYCPSALGLGYGWTNGYFSVVDYPLFQSIPGSPNWPFSIAIIGPDGKVLATGLSSDIAANKLDGFLHGETH
jgi:hypothetical protein